MAVKLYDFKLSGRTAASADGTATGIIATKAVEMWDDGSLRYTSANGRKVVLQLDNDLSDLLKQLLVGTGGVAAGKRFHGAP